MIDILELSLRVRGRQIARLVLSNRCRERSLLVLIVMSRWGFIRLSNRYFCSSSLVTRRKDYQIRCIRIITLVVYQIRCIRMITLAVYLVILMMVVGNLMRLRLLQISKWAHLHIMISLQTSIVTRHHTFFKWFHLGYHNRALFMPQNLRLTLLLKLV